MTWERRSGTIGRYYFHSVKVDGKVIKKYIGRTGDPIAEVIAKGDSLNRAEATAAVAEVRSEQAQYRDLERLLIAIFAGVREVHDVTLVACGYRRRKGRLQAVKYRDSKSDRSDQSDEPLTREVFEHLSRRANRGDRDAADRLRQILRDHPEITRELGNVSKHVEQSLIGLIAGDNFVLNESVRLQAQELRSSLLDEATDATLEKLLIDQVVISWLDAEYTRLAAVQSQQFKQDAKFWEQRCERASDRYLTAVKELATLREILVRTAAVLPMSDVADERSQEVESPTTS